MEKGDEIVFFFLFFLDPLKSPPCIENVLCCCIVTQSENILQALIAQTGQIKQETAASFGSIGTLAP